MIPLADDAGVQIVLETTAGQGSYLGGDFASSPASSTWCPPTSGWASAWIPAMSSPPATTCATKQHYRALWQEFDPPHRPRAG